MATFTETVGADPANAATAQLVGFAGGSIADLTDEAGESFLGANGADTINSSARDDAIEAPTLSTAMPARTSLPSTGAM